MAADAPANSNKEVKSTTIADDATIASSNAEALLAATMTLPPAYFNEAGRTLRVSIRALLGTIVTTPGTLTIRVRLGGLAGTLLATTAAMTLSTAGTTNQEFNVDFDVVTRATGATGTLVVKGTVVNQADSAPGTVRPLSNGATPQVTADLTAVPTQISVTAQFSISQPTNILVANLVQTELNSVRVQRVLA